MPVCKLKTAHAYGISLPNEWTKEKIQQNDHDSTPSLRKRAPRRLKWVCSTMDLCIQFPSTPLDEYDSVQFNPEKGREPRKPAAINPASAIRNDADKTISARLSKQSLLERLRTMKIKTSSSAEMAQERYKKQFDISVPVEPKYSSGNSVFVRFHVGNTLKKDKRAQETLKNLQSRKSGPF